MTTIRSLLVALTFSGLLMLPSPARATPEADAERFVRDRQEQLLDAIRQKADAKIDKAFEEMIDYGTLAQETLREYWGERSPKEREQFQCVLKGLVSDAHRKNLSKTLGYTIKFEGTTKTGRGYLVTTVATNAKNSREEPITIAYVVDKKDGKWLVEDIVTEGSSLVDNYRNQFRRIIKKDGFGELIRRMKKKLGKAGEKC